MSPVANNNHQVNDDSMSGGEDEIGDHELLVESELQAINEEQSNHEYQDMT